MFGPDETDFEPAERCTGGTDRVWKAERSNPTTTISHQMAASWRFSARHMCQGWLEGYLLTGRHGFFRRYEAFIHIIDSMFNQHAKWLKSPAPESPGGADCLAELPADVTRLAPGP